MFLRQQQQQHKINSERILVISRNVKFLHGFFFTSQSEISKENEREAEREIERVKGSERTIIFLRK